MVQNLSKLVYMSSRGELSHPKVDEIFGVNQIYTVHRKKLKFFNFTF